LQNKIKKETLKMSKKLNVENASKNLQRKLENFSNIVVKIKKYFDKLLKKSINWLKKYFDKSLKNVQSRRINRYRVNRYAFWLFSP